MSHRKSALRNEKIARAKALTEGTHTLPNDYPIPAAVLAQFEHDISGRVVCPWDKDYPQARTEFNPAYPTFPKLVVYCACLSDIRESLKLAQAYSLWAVARAGGHSLAGYSVCDGMVIDISAMDSVIVDADNKRATVAAGVQFGKLNAHLQSYGLHVPGGGCPTVAVAGYMQGGGYGFTSREFGIHSDNVVALKMVLADGRVVKASADINADLFWAVRGGTGNQFGILIEVTYQLYELGKVWGIRMDWVVNDSIDNAATALATIQDKYILSEDFNKLGFQTVLGYDSQFNDGLRVMFCAVFNGSETAFTSALKPLTDLNTGVAVTRLHDKYSTVDETLLERIPDIPGPQVKGMSQSRYLARPLAMADWRDIINFVKTGPNNWTTIDMEAYGGNINRYPVKNSAFIHRDVTMDFFCDVFWEEEQDQAANVDWLQSLMEFMGQYGNGHSYQNYPCRLQTDWKWAYFGPYYPSLVWVKQKYDPQNIFHYQQSITADLEKEHEQDYLPVMFDDPNIQYEAY